MRVLFISSSHNRQGNTANILSEIRKACEAKGAEAIWHDIAYMNISGCKGCQSCRGTAVCSIDDDMTRIKQDIIASDIVVLGSPIYMCSESGQAKCFIDRLYSLFQPDKEGNPGSIVPPGKRAVTIMTCKLRDGDKMYHYENTKYFKIFVNVLGFDTVQSFIVPGTGDPEKIGSNYYAEEAIRESVAFIFQ